VDDATEGASKDDAIDTAGDAFASSRRLADFGDVNSTGTGTGTGMRE
jgi:hypothetical protein